MSIGYILLMAVVLAAIFVLYDPSAAFHPVVPRLLVLVYATNFGVLSARIFLAAAINTIGG